jgi:hypothetical protein
MILDLAPENSAAVDLLRPEKNDRSQIGVHYVDAYLKPLKAGIALPDGSRFSAKRRGLKVTLTLTPPKPPAGGDQPAAPPVPAKGEGLMRRLAIGPDPVAMLRAALDEAGAALGVRLIATSGRLCLER